MIRVTKNGAYMDCYNPNEVKRAQSKGWTIVEKTEVKPEAKPKRVYKKRAKK